MAGDNSFWAFPRVSFPPTFFGLPFASEGSFLPLSFSLSLSPPKRGFLHQLSAGPCEHARKWGQFDREQARNGFSASFFLSLYICFLFGLGRKGSFPYGVSCERVPSDAARAVGESKLRNKTTIIVGREHQKKFSLKFSQEQHKFITSPQRSPISVPRQFWGALYHLWTEEAWQLQLGLWLVCAPSTHTHTHTKTGMEGVNLVEGVNVWMSFHILEAASTYVGYKGQMVCITFTGNKTCISCGVIEMRSNWLSKFSRTTVRKITWHPWLASAVLLPTKPCRTHTHTHAHITMMEHGHQFLCKTCI